MVIFFSSFNSDEIIITGITNCLSTHFWSKILIWQYTKISTILLWISLLNISLNLVLVKVNDCCLIDSFQPVLSVNLHCNPVTIILINQLI